MKRFALLFSLCLTFACQSPRTRAADVLPDARALVGDSYVSATAPPGELLATRWWERFEDSVLNELVVAVLAGNLDLEQAAASVREAEARARSAQGSRGPAINAAFDASRNRNRSLNFFPGGSQGGDRVYSNVLTPQITISWQADLFGRLRSIERARVADVIATSSDREALTHSLVAQAARLRIQVSLLERELARAREIVDSRTNTLDIVEGRYARGVTTTSAVDVHLARENLAAVRAALPALELDLEQSYFALDVLLGRKPGSGIDFDSLATALPIPDPPPPGVPLELLDQRPDLRAGRWRVESGAAEVDVSLAALYPDLSLSASGGWSAEELSDLFSADTFFGSIAASLTAPLFSSGRLRADIEIARARMDQLVAAYAGDVLQAIREVEDALVAEKGLRAELSERELQRDEALLAENLARDRYRRGLEGLLVVLDTERRRASADEQVLLLQAAVWNARIDLHLALGGDWFSEDTEVSR